MKKNKKENSDMSSQIQNMMAMMQAQLGGTGETPLMLAAAAGDIERILKEANIETQDKNGFTALMHAAAKGHLGAVRLLAEDFNADIYRKNANGDTALDLAVSAGHISVAGYLKSKSGSKIVFKKNANGITPLMSACARGDLKAVKWLVENGADKDEKDSNKDQKTPIMYAIPKGHLPVIRYLIETAKVNIEAQDASENTLLDQAVMAGHLPIVQYLKAKGGTIYRKRSWDGSSAIVHATSDGHIHIMDYFIREKMDINLPQELFSKSEKYQLPFLCLAMYAGQEKMFQYLIEKGANINAEFQIEKRSSSKKLTGTVMAWALSRFKKDDKFVDFLMQYKPLVKYDGDINVFGTLWWGVVAWEKALPATPPPNSTFFVDESIPPLISTEEKVIEEVIKDGKTEEKGFH